MGASRPTSLARRSLDSYNSVLMVDEKVTLTSDELSELFRKVDEVCQQAQKLWSELLTRMTASRNRDQSNHTGQPAPRRRPGIHDR